MVNSENIVNFAGNMWIPTNTLCLLSSIRYCYIGEICILRNLCFAIIQQHSESGASYMVVFPIIHHMTEPRCEKTCLSGFVLGQNQTRLLSHRR